MMYQFEIFQKQILSLELGVNSFFGRGSQAAGKEKEANNALMSYLLLWTIGEWAHWRPSRKSMEPNSEMWPMAEKLVYLSSCSNIFLVEGHSHG